MASNHTTNYQLCQWQADDQVRRTDFNEDNAKIDAALGELRSQKADQAALNAASERISKLDTAVQQITADLTKITFGSYSGNDREERTITLGFRPKAVLILSDWGGTTYWTSTSFQYLGGLALDGHPAYTKAGKKYIAVAETGFTLYKPAYDSSNNVLLNSSGESYYYIAFHS